MYISGYPMTSKILNCILSIRDICNDKIMPARLYVNNEYQSNGMSQINSVTMVILINSIQKKR